MDVLADERSSHANADAKSAVLGSHDRLSSSPLFRRSTKHLADGGKDSGGGTWKKKEGGGNGTGTFTNTLVLLDYDDTLFPTTELVHLAQERGEKDITGAVASIAESMTEEALRAWRKHDRQAARLVGALVRSGAKVRVVTNAAPGWIEATGTVLLPLTMRRMNHMGVPYESARVHQVEDETVTSESLVGWKRKAFTPILETSAPQHIVCMGDSYVEHEALRRVVGDKQGDSKDAIRKSFVWFQREPCICMLARQLHCVRSVLSTLLASTEPEAHFHLRPEKK
jgi:hypothetical protein